MTEKFPSKGAGDVRILQGEQDEYTLLDSTPFATGRTSICYRARNSLNAIVCIKQFTEAPMGTDSASGNEEFAAEIRARSKLKHPNILPIIDFGYLSREIPFIVSPLCDHDLRKILREKHFVPPSEALSILKQVAQAIDYAHASGVMHGDVKPENILFSNERSHVYLADFGTADFFSFSHLMATVPNNYGGGSTAYLSPEQLDANEKTARSDIYSFAVVAYELLTGNLPFDSKEPPFRQMAAKVEGRPRDPRALNPSLSEHTSRALLRGMDVEPQKRPPTATVLCQQMSDIPTTAVSMPAESDLTIHTEQKGGDLNDTLTERVIRWLRNKPLTAWIILCGIGIVSLGAVAEGIIHIRDLVHSKPEPGAPNVLPLVRTIARDKTPCRWVWVYFGRYNTKQMAYETPPLFRDAQQGAPEGPFPRPGQRIILTAQRAMLLSNYVGHGADKCNSMLEPPWGYAPDTENQYKVGELFAGSVVLVNVVKLMPYEEAEQVYVWALVGADY